MTDYPKGILHGLFLAYFSIVLLVTLLVKYRERKDLEEDWELAMDSERVGVPCDSDSTEEEREQALVKDGSHPPKPIEKPKKKPKKNIPTNHILEWSEDKVLKDTYDIYEGMQKEGGKRIFKN